MNDLRLYRLFQPSHYTLHINLERKKRTFDGTVTIRGQLTEPAGQITLHAHKLAIKHALVDGKTATTKTKGDSVAIVMPGLTVGEHTLQIEFNGKITNPMHGLYPCYFKLDGQDEELLATQFESHHAREVFPCIDEPEAKATFDLTLTTETGVEVISNTPITAQLNKSNKLVTSFATTPIMSPYLLAWVAGKLAHVEAKTSGGVIVRAYATPNNQSRLGYALGEAVKLLEFFDDYFGIPYPLPKCDLVALPDFSSGAMENWGCITFRETALLVDEQSSVATKQYVTSVIAHELAHQWFGNLVTMKWWNDLWLNESFANLMETFATDRLHPQWGMWTQYFDRQTVYAFERDSLSSVQKIQQEVHTPAEIQTLFDPAIVYAKGGSLLNMLHTHIGATAFQDGLRTYLKRHQYSNTEASDLWNALSESSGHNVMAFMEPWIAQPGFPVVTAGHDSNTIQLKQQRFYSRPQQAAEDTTAVWPIPLLSSQQLIERMLDQPSLATKPNNCEQPLLLNQGRTGYYLSLYSSAHLTQLATEVRTGHVGTIDRLGLLSDSLRLSSAGMLPLQASLELLDAYRHEPDFPVWGAITDHINALKMFADNDEGMLAGLRSLARQFAKVQHTRLGWYPTPDEPHFDTLLRPMIIAHMAYAQDETTVAKLRQLFAQAAQPSGIRADIRPSVFAAAIRLDGKPAFDKLLRWHGETASAEERKQIIMGLASLHQPDLVQRALDMLATDAVKLQDVFYWVVWFSRSRHTRDHMWQWMRDNWQWCTEQFGDDMHYADFPKYAASSFSTPGQLDSYKLFFEPKLGVSGLNRAIRQGIEDIESRILWRDRDQDAATNYLRSSR